MCRSEKRRLEREKKKGAVTYNFTQEQLDAHIESKVREKIDKAKKEAADLAFGLDSETTRILTRGKQEEPMHSFSTLIEWIKNELEEGGESNEDS